MEASVISATTYNVSFVFPGAVMPSLKCWSSMAHVCHVGDLAEAPMSSHCVARFKPSFLALNGWAMA